MKNLPFQYSRYKNTSDKELEAMIKSQLFVRNNLPKKRKSFMPEFDFSVGKSLTYLKKG